MYVRNMLANETFDIVVIGAGVVGSALAHRFSLTGANVLVLEKAAVSIGPQLGPWIGSQKGPLF